ncbi:MAG TPA: DUF4287 domain-containing protein [Aeromicrobium sp.]|nr:DUF4287 domain-containing protein [Aeromicrobium sp.]
MATDGPVKGTGSSDESFVAATGKTRVEWLQILDAEDVTTWDHGKIALWLSNNHDIPHWWCQQVTVIYEQERGLRLPGQRADGTFSVSASKSFNRGAQVLFDEVTQSISAGLGVGPSSLNPDANFPTIRWTLDDGTGVLAMLTPKGGDKTSVSLERRRLKSPELLEDAKAQLRAILSTL